MSDFVGGIKENQEPPVSTEIQTGTLRINFRSRTATATSNSPELPCLNLFWSYSSTHSPLRLQVEANGQHHAKVAFPSGKSPRIHCVGGWMRPTAGLDDFKKRKFLTPPPRIKTPDRPAPTEEL